ncbi:MAG: hypothetical protein M0Z99_22415 [Betaproteobacteria bacterium]|nr:hypothetical protein [Betaproteobacteria bacterium]
MNPLYRVMVSDENEDNTAVVDVPFTPFPGMFMFAPWLDEYQQVDEVYWDQSEQRFIVYLKKS